MVNEDEPHQGTLLKPEDIFRAGSGWDKELETRVDNELHQELRAYERAAHRPMLLRVVSSPLALRRESPGIFELNGRELGGDLLNPDVHQVG